jgi:serine phosphatase RsbU (regulator of sigma subunit)
MRLFPNADPSPRWRAPIDLVRATVLATVIISIWFPFHGVQMNPVGVFLLTGAASVALGIRIVRRRDDGSAAVADDPPRKRQEVLPLPELAFSVMLLWLSGGIQSPFFPTLFLVVMLAGIAHGPQSAGWTALLSGLLVVLPEAWRVPRDNPLAWVDDTLETLPYLFLTGLLTGRLSDALQRQQRARLAAQEEALRLQHQGEVFQRELELAARVQQALLPSELPSVPGVSVFAYSRSSRMIGGDLYDFVPLPDGAWLFLAADVSGHGIPAALLTAHTQHAIHQHASPDLAAMFADAGDAVCRKAPEEMFVTAVAVMLDPERGIVRCVNAGHPPPLWWQAESRNVASLPRGGIALGVFKRASYHVHEIALAPGDVLLLYTDGATDAFGPDGDRIEEEGLCAAFAATADRGPEATLAALATYLTEAGEPPDDITLVAIQWVGGAALPEALPRVEAAASAG